MSARNYTNTASVASITNTLNNTDGATAITCTGTLTGWPSTPCTAAINYGLSDEEIVLITSISGANATLTRGYDSSPKRNHTAGATLTHVASAESFQEANTHVNATASVHGITGALVGATTAQTLSNKTLTAPIIADFSNADHNHANSATGGNIPTASVTGLTASLASKAVDTEVMHLAGTETITGNKQFNGTTGFSTVNFGILLVGPAPGVPAAQIQAGGEKIASGFVHISTDVNARAVVPIGVTMGNNSYSVVCTASTTAGAAQLVTVIDSLRTTTQFVVEVYSGATPQASVGLNLSFIVIGA